MKKITIQFTGDDSRAVKRVVSGLYEELQYGALDEHVGSIDEDGDTGYGIKKSMDSIIITLQNRNRRMLNRVAMGLINVLTDGMIDEHIEAMDQGSEIEYEVY